MAHPPARQTVGFFRRKVLSTIGAQAAMYTAAMRAGVVQAQEEICDQECGPDHSNNSQPRGKEIPQTVPRRRLA